MSNSAAQEFVAFTLDLAQTKAGLLALANGPIFLAFFAAPLY